MANEGKVAGTKLLNVLHLRLYGARDLKCDIQI